MYLPGAAWKSRLILMPYLRAHCTAFKKYLTSNGLSRGLLETGSQVDERSLPGHALQERLSIPSLDSPVRERDSHPVQPSGSNLREIFLGLKHSHW